jgi:hypothetical protein
MPSPLFYCRDCGGLTGYRSRPRNFTEKYLLPLTFLRPVRCGGCFRRTYQLIFVRVRPRQEVKKTSDAVA